MTATETPKSTGEMMSDIMGNVSRLVRNEADLVRAEISESMGKLTGSLAAMLLALALGIVGLNLAAASLVAFVIEAGVPPHWAPLIVGAALLVIAFVIFSAAKSALRKTDFMPTRSARNVQRDAASIKETLNET